MTNDPPPSRTALMAAAARAAHLEVDHPPHIFRDTLAARLLGDQADELIAYHRLHGDHPVLAGARAQVVGRARYAEDRVVAAAGQGTDQYVILGAGLDSFAYRTTVHMRVFEVDSPATQRSKRERLARAGLDEPPGVTYVAHDFTGASLIGALATAGLDLDRPAMVSWLGVTMYLPLDDVRASLAGLSHLAPGSELILDHLVPEQLRDDDGRLYATLVAASAAEQGEPWHTFLTPDDARDLLAAHGWSTVAQLSQHDLPGLRDRTDALRPSTLARIAHAVLT